MGEIIIIGDVLKIALLSRTILEWPPLHSHNFYKQANHIRGPRTNFTVSPRPSNSFLAILKNILDQLQWWINRNQDLINVIPPKSCHLNRVGNSNDDIIVLKMFVQTFEFYRIS
jgi:hypothetical protein